MDVPHVNIVNMYIYQENKDANIAVFDIYLI